MNNIFTIFYILLIMCFVSTIYIVYITLKCYTPSIKKEILFKKLNKRIKKTNLKLEKEEEKENE